jgi:hypothetical protein
MQRQNKLQRQIDLFLAGWVGATICVLMAGCSLCSLLYTVLSLEIWLSSYSQASYVHVLAWSVMTYATAWLARKCYLILKRVDRDADRVKRLRLE